MSLAKKRRITLVISQKTGIAGPLPRFVEVCGLDTCIVEVYLKDLYVREGHGKTFDDAYDDVIDALTKN